MTGVRYIDGAFEGKCADCGRYWPLDLDFWTSRNMTRCRVCLSIARKVRLQEARARETDTEKAERLRIYKREWSRWYRGSTKTHPVMRGLSPEMRAEMQRKRNRERMREKRAA